MVLYSNKLDNYAHDYLHKYKAHLGISKFESQTHTHTHKTKEKKKKRKRNYDKPFSMTSWSIFLRTSRLTISNYWYYIKKTTHTLTRTWQHLLLDIILLKYSNLL